jgi:hypothetical protein
MSSSFKTDALRSGRPSHQILLLKAVLVAAMGSWTSQGATDWVLRFSQLQRQYTVIETIHSKTTLTVTNFAVTADGKPEVQQCVMEHWADNVQGFYRISSVWGAQQRSQKGYDTAYNGDLFQFLEREHSRLSIGRKQYDQNPTITEDPILFPVLFLGRNDDNCRACTMRFVEVLNSDRWQERLRQARLLPGEGTVVEIPGGTMGGGAYAYRVYFGTDSTGLPSRLDWVRPDGQVLFSARIPAYQTVSAQGHKVHLPKTVQYLAYKDGEVVIEMTGTTELQQINEEMPPEVFTIDLALAETVWDNDAKLFVKQRSDSVIPYDKMVTSLMPSSAEADRSQSAASVKDAGTPSESASADRLTAAQVDSAEVMRSSWSQAAMYAVYGVVCLALAGTVILLVRVSRRTDRSQGYRPPP